MFKDLVYIGETNGALIYGQIYSVAIDIIDDIDDDSPNSIILTSQGITFANTKLFLSLNEFRERRLDDLDI